MEVEKIYYRETHKQVKYIQDTFDSDDLATKEHSFLFGLLLNTLKNYNDNNTLNQLVANDIVFFKQKFDKKFGCR